MEDSGDNFKRASAMCFLRNNAYLSRAVSPFLFPSGRRWAQNGEKALLPQQSQLISGQQALMRQMGRSFRSTRASPGPSCQRRASNRSVLLKSARGKTATDATVIRDVGQHDFAWFADISTVLHERFFRSPVSAAKDDSRNAMQKGSSIHSAAVLLLADGGRKPL
nr:hypothetical protein Iba_chr04dCG14460 [Ipomoea batatas]